MKSKDNEEKLLANAKVVFLLAKKFGKGQWSFIGLRFLRRSGTSMEENSAHKEFGIIIAEKDVGGIRRKRMSNFPLQRLHCPGGELRSKGHGKLSIHFAATQETIETIFSIIVSANQLSLYGAVANMCEECESLHDRSGQPDMVMGQTIVLSEIKTKVPIGE